MNFFSITGNKMLQRYYFNLKYVSLSFLKGWLKQNNDMLANELHNQT